jgi:hypothetical protein
MKTAEIQFISFSTFRIRRRVVFKFRPGGFIPRDLLRLDETQSRSGRDGEND